MVCARYSVVHSGSWKNKETHRKITGVALIDVGSPDLREMLVNIISGKDLKVLWEGKSLKVTRAKPKSASDRDGVLVKASEFRKKQVGAKDISIEWVGTRGVKVEGTFAYFQPVGNEVGTFVRSFAHLKLP